MGCFADNNQRDLSAYLIDRGILTIDICISTCRSNNYAYAGLQDR
jgi:hypothetical protein